MIPCEFDLKRRLQQKQPKADPRADAPNTGLDTSLGQPVAAEKLYPGWIETYSGVQWNCANPRPEDVNIGDIAHGMALMCRFGGQVREYYTVGQHSLYVLGDIKKNFPKDYNLQLHALLHDASEAYLSDIVRPLKVQMPQYLDIEKKTMSAITTAFGLSPLTPLGESIVKAADNAALAAEYRDLYPNSKLNWTLPEEPLDVKIVPVSDWRYIEHTIIEQFYTLKSKYYDTRRILQVAYFHTDRAGY